MLLLYLILFSTFALIPRINAKLVKRNEDKKRGEARWVYIIVFYPHAKEWISFISLNNSLLKNSLQNPFEMGIVSAFFVSFLCKISVICRKTFDNVTTYIPSHNRQQNGASLERKGDDITISWIFLIIRNIYITWKFQESLYLEIIGKSRRLIFVLFQ